jgi:hypothetical protein
VAVLAAGLGKHDCDMDYVCDVFTSPRKEGYDRNTAVGYTRFARDVAAMSEPEIARKYNMELGRAVRWLPNAGTTAQQFIEMYQRHARVVCGVLDDQIQLHSPEFVAGTVDPTSLLGIVVRGDGAEADVGQAEEPQQWLQATAGREEAAGNVFRRDGEKWTATFDGSTKHFADTKGMRYLNLLIAHPNREFRAMALVRLVDGQPTADRSPRGTRRALEEDGLVETGLTDAGETIDDRAKKDLRDRLQAIDQEIASARIREDDDEEARLERDKEAMVQYYSSAVGLGGGKRKSADPHERARKLAGRSIERALNRIRKEHPALHDHLKKAVRTGQTLVYQPDRPIDWATD